MTLVLRSLPLPQAFYKSVYVERSKSSPDYIVMIMMTSFMRVSYMLVFHHKNVCALLSVYFSTIATYISSCSFMYLCFPCYCDACLKSSALRVVGKALHITMQLKAYNLLIIA